MKKHGRDLGEYRRARLYAERGLQLKKTAPLRVCLVFPNTYHVGMSNLAVHTLYDILNARSDCICERSFCEEPLLGYSIESGSRLGTFDIIAFTISFELDYPSVLKTLLAARIPLRHEDRDWSHPLIIAGGPCIVSNPEPLADCIDLLAVGDGEELVNEIVDDYTRSRARRTDRASALRSLSEIPGVYVPSLFTPAYSTEGALAGMEPIGSAKLPVAARMIPDLDAYPCRSVIVTPDTEFSNMVLIEIGRGCRRGCRFCSACHTSPRRTRSFDTLKNQLIAARDLSDRVGLVTSDLADYPQREELLRFLLDERLGFSVSSVRADAITDDLMAGMKASRQRTLTLAPEVASDRLAAVSGKRITTDALMRAIDMALEHRIASFRLYFMIGLPGEEDDDVAAIVEMALRVHRAQRKAAKDIGKMGVLTLSVNPFVPKPFTPLELEPFADHDVLSGRIELLRKGLSQIANTRIIVESPRMARLQCAFARGDRRALGLAEMLAAGQTAAQVMRVWGDYIERCVNAQSASAAFLPWHTIEPATRQGKRPAREESQ